MFEKLPILFLDAASKIHALSTCTQANLPVEEVKPDLELLAKPQLCECFAPTNTGVPAFLSMVILNDQFPDLGKFTRYLEVASYDQLSRFDQAHLGEIVDYFQGFASADGLNHKLSGTFKTSPLGPWLEHLNDLGESIFEKLTSWERSPMNREFLLGSLNVNEPDVFFWASVPIKNDLSRSHSTRAHFCRAFAETVVDGYSVMKAPLEVFTWLGLSKDELITDTEIDPERLELTLGLFTSGGVYSSLPEAYYAASLI